MARKKRKYLRSGVSMITSGVAIGMLPNPTGSAAVTTMKTNALQGMAGASKAYPIVGKLAGAGMIIKQTKKLTNITKPKRRKKK